MPNQPINPPPSAYPLPSAAPLPYSSLLTPHFPHPLPDGFIEQVPASELPGDSFALVAARPHQRDRHGLTETERSITR